MYFHTDSPTLLSTLGYLMTEGAKQGGRVRLDVDEAGRLRYKVGEGMWSPPISSTPDPYRDGE